jgi:iron(III) transport system substrate-binding protein
VRIRHFFTSSILEIACLVFVASLIGCGRSANTIVIYTSVDRDYSEPILTAYQQQNPQLKIDVIYDSELTKTTGLYQRLLQEKRNPQADVFWNNEIVRTIQLKNADVLAPYKSAAAEDIPALYKDAGGYWTGFSARARVTIINTAMVPETETPASVPALAQPRYTGKIGMAKPEFGTTVTHMAALYATIGKGLLTLHLNRAIANQMKVLPGNAVVRDEVAKGNLAFGLTDTDDAYAAIADGKPVRMAFLDQNGEGTLLIPNTVSLIKDCANPEGGKKLIDYLLSADVEAKLAQSRARQIPVRSSIPRPDGVPSIDSIKAMKVDYNKIAENVEPCLELMRKLFQ